MNVGLENLRLTWQGPTYQIGVTGGIASGKSAFSRALESAGAIRLDADQIAREALEAPEMRESLAAAFGPEVLTADSVSRSRLAAVVFADPEMRQKLEQLIHPEVRRRYQAAVRAGDPGSVFVYDVPLLFEAGLAAAVDLSVVVSAAAAVRRERALQRSGWTHEEFEARERAQMPLEEKEKRADLVVRNESSPERLGKVAEDLMERIRRANPRRATQ